MEVEVDRAIEIMLLPLGSQSWVVHLHDMLETTQYLSGDVGSPVSSWIIRVPPSLDEGCRPAGETQSLVVVSTA